MLAFTIEPDKWYAAISIGCLEGLSSASSELYFPIRVNRITPLKSGNRIFMLDCFQSIAREGRSNQLYQLQMLDRGQKGLIAKHIEDTECLLYITDLDHFWMDKHFPNVVPADSSVVKFLEQAFERDRNELSETLVNAVPSNATSADVIEHWGSQRYWKDAFELLQKLDEKRLFSLDLHAIRASVFHGDSIAYRLMDAMCSVKQQEGMDGFKGAPRLLLLTLALLENYSQNCISTPTNG